MSSWMERRQAELAAVARPPSVLAEVLVSAGDAHQDRRAGERAGELGAPVEQHLARGHPAGQEHAQAHRRIDVAARDRPEAVGEGDDGEAERQRDAELADVVAAQDGGAAAEQHQDQGADEFRSELGHA